MKRAAKILAGVAAAGLFACGTTGTAYGQADVIVGDLAGVGLPGGGVGPRYWGNVSGMSGYSIGTTSCNIGTVNLNWFQSGANAHPVIAQNIYRIDDGMIMQLGQSYLKHGFCALQQGLCGSCTPAGGGCTTRLGVGCSDPYSASLNGSQGGLGPKWQVNATLGTYVWPYSQSGQTGNQIFKRVQVPTADVDPANYPDAIYVAEGHYVAFDDASAGNDDNNASYRILERNGTQAGSGGFYLRYRGGTQRQDPAIIAWAEHGLGVAQPDPSVNIQNVHVDGLFLVGHSVRDNGDGTWRYAYAVQNLNSDRSADEFRVPLPAGVNVSGMGFNDVEYHSGEPYDNTDWSMTAVAGDSVTWKSPESFDQNPNSNALRWGTMYTFWFNADTAPTDVQATLSMFKPGGVPDVSVAVSGPEAGIAGCTPADVAEPFGTINVFDILGFLDIWENNLSGADYNDSGSVDIFDILDYLAEWELGCP